MEIKFKDNPITIKTMTVDSKKLSKQTVQQFELSELYYIHLKDKTLRNILNLTNEYEIDRKDYRMYGEIIGWINLKFDRDDVIEKSIRPAFGFYDSDVLTVLFINEGNSTEIKRAYIPKIEYMKLFGGLYPKIII